MTVTYRQGRELGLSRHRAFLDAFIPMRLRLLWNIVRGRPVLYRVNLASTDGITFEDMTHALIVEGRFRSRRPDVGGFVFGAPPVIRDLHLSNNRAGDPAPRS